MPRRPRVILPGIPVHVTLRGNNRRRLFSSVGDHLRMLDCLERGVDATGCAIHQLTLMANHVHMITTPSSKAALAAMIKRACQRYAQIRNKARKASGKLFEERYFAKLIEDDEYFMTAMLYSDSNAYDAGLVAHPLAHPWSTGPLHAARPGSRIPLTLWTPSPWYLRLGADAATRASVYEDLMMAYVAKRSAEKAAQAQVQAPERTVRRYTLRLERPDRSTARDGSSRFARKGERSRGGAIQERVPYRRTSKK